MGHLIEFLIQTFVQLQTYDSNAFEIVSLAGILVKESLVDANSAMYVD